MPKKTLPHYKKIQPDPKYQSLVVARFINFVMRRGKKATARKIVYGTLDLIKKRTKSDPLEIFDKALKNVGPYVEIKTKRIGGANYQVPIEVGRDRRLTLSMRWIIESAQNQDGKPMKEHLSKEILLASKKSGTAFKKKEDTHRMAEANKAFAHFARF